MDKDIVERKDIIDRLMDWLAGKVGRDRAVSWGAALLGAWVLLTLGLLRWLIPSNWLFAFVLVVLGIISFPAMGHVPKDEPFWHRLIPALVAAGVIGLFVGLVWLFGEG